MNPPEEYSPLTTDAQAAAYARLVSLAFGRPVEDTFKWLGKQNRADIRLITSHRADAAKDKAYSPVIGGIAADPDVCAGALIIPMGQFFGGRSVPMAGIAAVAVAPETRGRGVATRLMRSLVQETHAKGVAISTLYGASTALYRGVGYERAGHWFEIRVPLQRMATVGGTERDMPIRPFVDSDRAALREIYRASAAGMDGTLDRGHYVWDRIENPQGEQARAFVVEGDGGAIEGWAFLTQPASPEFQGPGGGKHEVRLHSIGATTGRAGRRLWSFLSGFATVGTDAVLYGGPAHPMLMHLAEQTYKMTLRYHWQTRITDVAAALKARGYPHGVRAELHIQVSDELIPENAGAWVLEVGGDVAMVHKEKGPGRGDLKMDISALAAMYTGFLSATQLAAIGKAEGTEAALRAAGAVFCGGASAGGGPAMYDMF